MPKKRLSNLKANWAPLHERTYQEVKTAIMSGKFMPGEKLTVRGIAGELGVSLMPARAALLRLAAERALELSETSGSASIPLMSLSRFNEISKLRALLEGRATEEAASHMSAAAVAELEKCLAQLESASKKGDSDQYLEANQKFKFTVFRFSNQPVLTDLIERLWMQVGPFMRYYGKGFMDLRTNQHRLAFKALAAKNGKEARKALEIDVKEGAEFLLANAEFLGDSDRS